MSGPNISAGTIEALLRLRDEMASTLNTSTRPAIQQTAAALSALQARVASNAAPIAALKAQLALAKDELKNVADAAAKFGEVGAKALGTELTAAGAKVDQLTNQIKALEQTDRAATAALKDAAAAAKKAGDEAGDAAEKHKRLDTALREAGSASTRVGMMMSAITAAEVGAATAAIKFGTDFETNLTQVKTLAGASRAEIDGMRQKLIDLGPAVGIGPAELAKGLFVVESEGYRGAQALDILTMASKGVALGMGDSFTVTRTLVTTLKAFQEQGLTAAQAMDTLVATVQQGDMPIDTLAGALGRVNAIAAAVGVPFSEVGAAIATFTRVGVSASEAVTGLRAVLISLEAPTKKTRDALKSIGMTTEDLRKAIAERGLAETMLMLMDRTQGNVDKLKELIPNVRGLVEALSTAKSQGNDYRVVLDKIRNSQGLLDSGFADTAQTLAFKWKQLKSEAEGLAIKLGDLLLPRIKEAWPYFESLVKGASDAVQWFSELPKPVQFAALALAGVLGAIGPLLVAFGQVLTTGAVLVSLFGGGAAGSGIAVAAAAAGTAIATVLVPALLVIAVPAALYEVVRLFTQVKGLFDDSMNWRRDAEGVASTMKNEMATAARLAGREFTTYGEAHAFVTQRVKELQAANPALAASIKDVGVTLTIAADGTAKATRAVLDHGAAHTKTAGDVTTDTTALKEHAKALQSVVDKLSGAGAIKQAQLYVEALKGVTDFSKLTKEAQEDIGKTMQKAIDVYAASGRQIPKDIDRIWESVGQLSRELKVVDGLSKTAFSSLGLEIRNISLPDDTFEKTVASMTKATTIGATWIAQVGLKVPAGFKEAVKAINQAEQAQRRHLQAIEETGAALQQLGQTQGGIVGLMVGGIGSIVSAWGAAKRAILEYQKAGVSASGGDVAGALASGALSVNAATSSGGAASRVIGGATSGAAAGLSAGLLIGSNPALSGPSLGTSIIIGAAVGALVGWIKAKRAAAQATKEANAEIAKMNATLITTYGSLQDAQAMAQKFGLALNTTAKGVQGQAQLQAQTQALAETMQKLTEDVQKYGVSWQDIADPTQRLQAFVNTTTSLTDSFTRMKQAGYDADAIVRGMSGDLNDWLKSALAAGMKIPAAMAPIIQKLIETKQLTEENARALLGLAPAASASFDDIKAAADRYGITLDELGPKVNQLNIDQLAAQLSTDWKLLTSDSEDVNGVMAKMKDKVQDVVTAAFKFGDAIPDSMKPMIDKMIEAGLLTDQFGTKLTDDSKLTWSQPLTDKIADLVEAMKGLVDVIKSGLGGALTEIGNRVVRPKVKPYYDPSGLPPEYGGDSGSDDGSDGSTSRPPSGAGAVRGYATGTNGYEYFGGGTLAMLHGWEKVTPMGREGSGPSATPASQPIVLQVDGREMTRVVVPLLPDYARRKGLDR